MNVAVVGAGIHGVSTARVLAGRGHTVSLFEQFRPGHNRGSSHGRSRIVRRAYADPFYTACMAEAYPLWHDLEQACGRRLLHEVGLFYFGREDSADLRSTLEGLSDLRVPHVVVGPNDATKIFPDLRFGDGEFGIFTPQAGWVEADKAVAETLRLARGAGCEVISRRVGPDDLAAFDRVAVCPGPWVRDWWPDAPVRVSLQTVSYMKGDHQGPVWIEDGPNLLYGFPSNRHSFKVGVHRQGPEVDPGSADRDPRPEDVELARGLARRRFGIENAEVVETQACLYTNTPSEDFLLKRLDDRTFLASACSGHGFKFGPWMGNVMADLVEGRRELGEFSRFAG